MMKSKDGVMRRFLMGPLLAVLLLVSNEAMCGVAGTAFFTALEARDERELWVGIKLVRQGYEVDSMLAIVGAKNLKARIVPLPMEIRNREIVGLVAAKGAVLVITQWTLEDGDNPQVHVFDLARGRWQRLGEVPCPLFDAMEVKSNSLVLHCQEALNRGLEAGEKRLDLSGHSAISERARIALPQSTIVVGRLSAVIARRQEIGDALQVNVEERRSVLYAAKLAAHR